MRGLPENLSASVRRLNPALAGSAVPAIMTQGATKPEGHQPAGPIRFTIWGEPIGAPRQSRRDTWNPRPCVVRYRDWKDKARASAPAGMTQEPLQVLVVAFVAVKPSWSKKKQAAMVGQFHRVKPDGDNIFKGCADALWEQDSCIAVSRVEKRWCAPGEERVEVEVIA